MIIKFILLAALIRVLIATGQPFLCSGIYAGVHLLFGFFFADGLVAILLSTGLVFVLASVYFWLLNYMEDASFGWWAVAIGGLLIGLV